MRYDLIDESKSIVILKDTGQSGYDSWLCFDRRTAEFFDLTEDRSPEVLALIRKETAEDMKIPMKKY